MVYKTYIRNVDPSQRSTFPPHMNRIRFELKSQFTPKDKRIDGIRLKPKSDRLFESPKGEKKNMFFTHSILGADGFLNVLAQVPRGPACL